MDPDPDPFKWYGSNRIRIRNTSYEDIFQLKTQPFQSLLWFDESIMFVRPPEEFRNHLLAFKHKMRNVVWTKVNTQEVFFYLKRFFFLLFFILKLYFCSYPTRKGDQNENIQYTPGIIKSHNKCMISSTCNGFSFKKQILIINEWIDLLQGTSGLEREFQAGSKDNL